MILRLINRGADMTYGHVYPVVLSVNTVSDVCLQPVSTVPTSVTC